MIPKRICLCGGGVNVVAHVGALKELNKRHMLKSVKEWMGVSAGALMAMCIVVGYSFEEIEHFYMGFDFKNISDIDDAPGWILNFGMDTGQKLKKLVEACLHVKGLNEKITFKELYDLRQISLRVFVTDLNDGELKDFSHKTAPNKSIVEAVCGSMSIPYYFQPVIDTDTNHYLVDGGVISNYPMFALSHDELSQTIGIYFKTNVDPKSEIDMEDFAMRPLQMMLATRGRYEIKTYSAQTICIPIGSRSSVNFDISEDQKKELINLGKESVLEYLKNMRHHIKRRYSVS